MTTRIRTDESAWQKGHVSRKVIRVRDGRTVTNDVLTTTKGCLGLHKQTVDVIGVAGYTNARKHLKAKTVRRLASPPRYAHPYLKAGVPYPHPFKVGSIVGPDNYYGEIIEETVDPKTGSDVYLKGSIIANVFADRLNLFFLPYNSSAFDGQIVDYTYQNAEANIRSAQVDVGTTLGELVETVSFLVSPVKSILKLNRKFGLSGSSFREILHKGKRYFEHRTARSASPRIHRMHEAAKRTLRNGARVVDESSNFWLGYRFGVRPLLQDIDNYCKLAASGLEPPKHLNRARAKYEKFVVTNVSNESLGWVLAAQAQVTTTVQETYRTNIHFLQKGVSLIDDLDVLGLNASNIPGLMWELTPLSFVFDRFVSIGTWIAAKRPKPGTEVLGATHSRKILSSYQVAPRKVYQASMNPANYKTSWYSEPQTWLGECYERQIAGNPPALPVFNPRLLDLSQWIDHITLLWQRMPKFRR